MGKAAAHDLSDRLLSIFLHIVDQFLRRAQYDLSGYSCRVLSHIG